MKKEPVKLLLIDDDKEEYNLVRKYLKGAHSGPYEIEWVSTFEKAIDTIASSQFDLCLLDYNLGERTGMELLQEIKVHKIGLPVVLLTGQANFDLDVDAMEKGVSDFLEKGSLTPVLLERTIRYAMENHRARTELQMMNEELEARVLERTNELSRSNQMLEQFANIVANDLQRPLRILHEHIEETLAREAETQARDYEVASRVLNPVLHATKNLTLMVQIVLEFSQADGHGDQFADVDLFDVVNEVRAEHSDACVRLSAKVDIDPLPNVWGDRQLLKGLIENLLHNALVYRSSDPPHVHVSAERQNDLLLVAVRDNGIGISAEDAEDIFLMFSGATSDDDYEGTGLGLALCRKISQFHGGRIWVDSEPGQGSTFYVALPTQR